jgi:hypothetical protein
MERVERDREVERFKVNLAIDPIFNELPVALSISPPQLHGALAAIRREVLGQSLDASVFGQCIDVPVRGELVAKVVAGGRLRERRYAKRG